MRAESSETNRVSNRGNQHSDAPNLDPLLRLDSERQRNDPAQTRNEIASLHPEPAPDAPNPSVRNFRHRSKRLESVPAHSRKLASPSPISAFLSILLQKSKIEQPQKSRES
jgi:hypothetical protein